MTRYDQKSSDSFLFPKGRKEKKTKKKKKKKKKKKIWVSLRGTWKKNPISSKKRQKGRF